MRLWHKDLIKVLPNAQLKGQWNEIGAIIGSIKKHNSPRHGLVNYIMEYCVEDFRKYCSMVLDEIKKRNEIGTLNYKPNGSIKNYDEFFEYPKWFGQYSCSDLYAYHHDYTYLHICYWNLYEKCIRGLITQEEFHKVARVYKRLKADE